MEMKIQQRNPADVDGFTRNQPHTLNAEDQRILGAHDQMTSNISFKSQGGWFLFDWLEGKWWEHS